ncbi:MAG: hypothetical protein IPJ81_18470 [Chitinophagaceae bacterium]|nr:hypothetical protein [Chitinophagaceae bacterium]
MVKNLLLLALTRNAILQHRFKQADSLLQLAKAVGIKKYDALATAFDVNFELGKIIAAEGNLNSIKAGNDYGYQFRQSRMMHYKGDLDSSINAMQQAVLLANTDSNLMQVALANVADLYIHTGKLNKAYEAYTQCIKINATDLRSIMGMGWIALMYDNNDSLAEKYFSLHLPKQNLRTLYLNLYK